MGESVDGKGKGPADQRFITSVDTTKEGKERE